MRKRSLFLLIFSCLLLICAGLFFLFFQRPHLLIVADSRYAKAQLPREQRFAVNQTAFQRGWTSSFVIIDTASVEEAVQKQISRRKAAMVICSPLIAAVLADEKLSASEKSAPTVVTIGQCTDSCDFALVANLSDEGWADAAHKLQQIPRPLHVALLYSTQDGRSVAAAELFRRSFSHPLEVIAIDKTSAREVRNTMAHIASRNVDVVIAPYVKDFYLFTQDGQAEGFSWVVDAYAAPLVPKERLAGVVSDDLAASITLLFDSVGSHPADGSPIILPLVRSFRAAEKGKRSLF